MFLNIYIKFINFFCFYLLFICNTFYLFFLKKRNFESSTLQNQLAETKIKELESRVKRLSDAYDGKSRLATFQTKLDDIQEAEEKCLKRQAIMRKSNF